MIWQMVVTAYTIDCRGCTGVFASGGARDPSALVVAASPAWPFGTCLEMLAEGQWERIVVEDRGSAIDKRNELDLLVMDKQTARAWGRRSVPVRYCDDTK